MKMNDKNQKLARWYFGGLGSAGAACCTHPLDLLKVNSEQILYFYSFYWFCLVYSLSLKSVQPAGFFADQEIQAQIGRYRLDIGKCDTFSDARGHNSTDT